MRVRFVILFFGLAVAAQAQTRSETDHLPSPASERASILFDRLSIEDGLSQSSVYDILQDRNGYMWFATQEGLNRYDGHEFKVYKRRPFDTTSFRSNWIWSMSEAPDGSIWTGLNGGGIGRLDPVSGTVTSYANDPDDSTSLSHNFVFDVLVDSEGMVWGGTPNGLNRLDPESGRITLYESHEDDTTSLSHPWVGDVYEDSEGTIWVGTINGVNRLDKQSGTFERFFTQPSITPGPGRVPQNGVLSIVEDDHDASILWLTSGRGIVRLSKETGRHDVFTDDEGKASQLIRIVRDPSEPGVFWATTDGHGLARFDSRSERFLFFEHDPRDPKSINGNALFGLYADRSGMMWSGGSAAGVAKFRPSLGGFTSYKHRAGDETSLDPNNVWGVYVAPSEPHAVWAVIQEDAARTSERLNRIDQRTGGVEHFVHRAGDPSSLGPGRVYDMHEDRLGQLWVATQRGGLQLFDRRRGTFQRYTHSAGNEKSISDDDVHVIHEDADGMLWMGTHNGGLNRMDPRRPGVFTRYTHDADDSTSLSANLVARKGLAEDAHGALWIGTDGGLNRLDRQTGQIQRFVHDPDDPRSLSSNNVDAVFVDGRSTVWSVVTVDGDHVLERLDPETGSFTHFVHDPTDRTSLSDRRISDIHERKKEPGVLWIGSPAGGLTRLDDATGTFKHYSEEDGLANNFVYGILEDDDGRLWLSTNNGLSRFDPETEAFRNFFADDGLQSNEFNSFAFFRSATGQMIFGGIGGVTAFYPHEIKPNEVPPSVVFSDFKLFNRSVLPGEGSVLRAPLQETSEIELAHWQRTVTFDYVGLHFLNPSKNRYEYKLDGFDEEWVEAGSRRSATYTNLDPGTYTFRVRAANSDGVWSPEGAAMALIVAPPIWQTWWFRMFAVLAVVALGFSAYSARVRQIRDRNRHLESEVASRTEELGSKNEQLEKSHAIVRAINAETGFEKLLHSVLEQTKVIPGVEKASALVFDESEDAYVFRASLGWNVTELAALRMTEAEAQARYIDHAEEVAEDIFLERNVTDRPGSDALKQFETPASLMVMRVRAGGRTEGYLVFDNMTDRDAFDRQDLELLISLREHIRSAFAKTRLLEDLRRSLEHLKMTQTQLVQAEKMASLGQLTAGIAHEIKNPLNFINNFAALCEELADELAGDIEANRDRTVGDVADELKGILADLKTNASKIQQHGLRADGIVRSMLQHSRGKSGEMQLTDINGLLDEYVNLSYHGMRAQQADFNVAIDRDFDESVGKLRVVPQELGRVLINLLNNAFYAVHEKSLELNGDYVPRVTVTTRRKNGQVEMRVADNGPGIPEPVRRKIFEPFFTTKPTGEGTGLGLSLSYDIVTQVHGGDITLESSEGEGTAFIIKLPTTQP